MRVCSISYRVASVLDVPAMLRIRETDHESGPGDERMISYLDGRHHPHKALAPRTVWIAETDTGVAGYVGGHLSRRFDCDGELQYLYVAPSYRRSGVAGVLVRHLARWFVEHGAQRICVNVNQESPGARPFYRSLGADDLQAHWMVWPDIKVVIS